MQQCCKADGYCVPLADRQGAIYMSYDCSLTEAFCGLVQLRNEDLWELTCRETEHHTRAIPWHHQNLTIISSINWNITWQSHEAHMT